METIQYALKQALGIKFGTFTIENLATALITFIVCFVAIKIIMKILKPVINKLPIDETLHRFSLSIIKALLYFITAVMVLQSFGISASSLIALFSVVGLAVSLAVQGSLSNLANGIVLLITKPFLVGDFIETGSISGTVKEIGLVHTKLMTFDNKTIFIPNSDISASKIINYSSAPLRRVDLYFDTSYNAKAEDVKKAILKAVNNCNVFLNDPPACVNVSSYKDSSIEYFVRAWVKTDDYWTGYYDLIEKVKTEFDTNNIEMTYNHINVHMIKE